MSGTIAAWSVTYLLHSTLLIGLIWIASRWVRSASARDTLWKVALCGGIVTATVQTFSPVERFVPSAEAVRVTFDAAAVESVAPAFTPRALEAAASPALPSLSVSVLLLSLWLLVTFALLVRIAIGHGRFLSVVGDRVEIVTGPERERLDRLCRLARVRRLVRLTESAALVSPVAMLGWEIVLPAKVFARLSEEQKDTILAHELGHLLRHDPLWLTFGEAVKAVLFFQPLNWLVQAKSKETAEFLCDDAAVLQTGRPKALAETLAELASYPAPAPPAVAAMAEGGSNLMVRVARMLQSDPVAPLRLHVRLALALVVLGATAAFAPGMVAGVVKAYDTDKVNYVSDAILEQNFEGPDGETHVEFNAHEAEIAKDGSYAIFHKSNGYLRVTQTSERGPKREVEILPRGGKSEYRYKVDGVDQAWCEDARRVVMSAFYQGGAYGYPTDDDVRPRKARRAETLPSSDEKDREWGAWVELTGTRDGVPTYVSVKAKGIFVNYGTGAIEVKPEGHLDVLEKVGSLQKSFRMTADDKSYEGAFDGREAKASWLTGILRQQTTLPDNVIESLAR
jgi:beta-lactamase regulating signal transducer with metallopeptidase domain